MKVNCRIISFFKGTQFCPETKHMAIQCELAKLPPLSHLQEKIIQDNTMNTLEEDDIDSDPDDPDYMEVDEDEDEDDLLIQEGFVN